MFRFIIGATLLLMSLSAWANLPYYPLQFSRDEAAHFENVSYPVDTLTESWYYNGTLTSKTGRKLGYYVSFNYIYHARLRLTLPSIQIQVTDIDNQKVYGKQLVLMHPITYSIASSKLDIRYGKTFSLEQAESAYTLNTRLNSEQGPTLSLSLRLTPNPLLNPLLIGENGLIDMWTGTNSYYYSIPELITEGFFQIGHELFELDVNKSLSWMSHQWGDFLLLGDENQWMKANVQLKNGLALNVFVIVDEKSKKPLRGVANIILPDHSTVVINDLSKFTYTPHEVPKGEKYPHTYDVSIPEVGLELQLNALAPGQDVNGIWEGVSQAEGVYQGTRVTGQAYTESHVVY
ncbi:MAG: lipocalin-like domain-containing protein [Gammaproteobacteria bacterium]